jgi:hypothetical protein
LHNLPAWLQLLTQALPLLLPAECPPDQRGGAGAAAAADMADDVHSREQQLQAVLREWQPAWEGAMQQMGAAVLLLQQQQQHHTPPKSKEGSSSTRKLEQQLGRQATAATVQALWVLFDHLKVGVPQ